MKTSALVSAGVVFSSTAGSAAGTSKPLLCSIKGEGVPGDLAGALKRVLEPLGGMQAFVKKGQTVLVKPNMGFPTPPELHATTSPGLVAAVVEQALQCGASKVLVVDNPTRRPEACMRTIGIKEAIAGLDAHLLMPTSDKFYKQIPVPKGKSLKRTRVFEDALDTDVHIAMPVAKSHNAAGYSGALKGMMGLILDRESFHARLDLNQAIADLNTVLKADLIVMDGLKVMTTDGPAGPGELATRNTVVAGLDPVAVDAYGVSLAPLYGRRIKPRQIKHLKKAREMGLGKLSPPADLVVEMKM